MKSQRTRRGGIGMIGVMALCAVGCAADPPKPAPTVTPDQVRSHSDKAFDKLKLEEQQRGGEPGTR